MVHKNVFYISASSTGHALVMNYILYRALNPNSNLPLSPISRLPPRMEQNPAYGQLSLSVDSNSTDYPGQSGGLAGVEYENTAGTIGSYAYITPT